MTDIRKPGEGDDAAFRAALSKESLDIEPPPELEEKTVAALRTGDLVGPKASSAWRKPALILGAAVLAGVIFFGGLFSGRQMVATSVGGSPRFALLLYGASTGDDVNAHAARAMEYSAWADQPHDVGRVVSSESLTAEGALLRLAATEPSQEGDSAALAGPGGEELEAYVVVSAPTIQDAVRLAREHPHLKRGGTIVVRPILPHMSP